MTYASFFIFSGHCRNLLNIFSIGSLVKCPRQTYSCVVQSKCFVNATIPLQVCANVSLPYLCRYVQMFRYHTSAGMCKCFVTIPLQVCANVSLPYLCRYVQMFRYHTSAGMCKCFVTIPLQVCAKARAVSFDSCFSLLPCFSVFISSTISASSNKYDKRSSLTLDITPLSRSLKQESSPRPLTLTIKKK